MCCLFVQECAVLFCCCLLACALLVCFAVTRYTVFLRWPYRYTPSCNGLWWSVRAQSVPERVVDSHNDLKIMKFPSSGSRLLAGGTASDSERYQFLVVLFEWEGKPPLTAPARPPSLLPVTSPHPSPPAPAWSALQPVLLEVALVGRRVGTITNKMKKWELVFSPQGLPFCCSPLRSLPDISTF